MRHGETDWNKKKLVQGRKDIPLNEYGRHLARETSYGMRQYQIDLAYTSPLQRAKETAEILLEGRNIPLYEDQRIQEISFGSYEGMSCVDKNGIIIVKSRRTFLKKIQERTVTLIV